ncbi:uncharacterized protein [Cicer arietinum]|uniref:uncharacterized protein isoform X2 n=1 Tax=Cicer arietinum TaxID=3827 RepID=UPI003CC688B8
MTYQKQNTQNYVVLRPCICLAWTVILTLCVTAVFFLWPRDPEVEMERLTVRKVRVHPLPPLSADVALSLTVNVHNSGFYFMELGEVDVGVKYRGNKLGHVETEGWHVGRRSSAHVFGELEFSGLASADVAHLMQDIAKGRVHFHTSVEVTGQLGLSFFHVPKIFKD